MLADKCAVDDARPVGTADILPTRRVIVTSTLFPQCRVVRDHGIHASGGESPEQKRFTQPGDVRPAADIRLRDDADTEARGDEHLPDDGDTDLRGIDVCVAVV